MIPPPIHRLPNELLLKILKANAYRADLDDLADPTLSASVVQEISTATNCNFRLVCRKWAQIGEELLYRSMFIQDVNDIYHVRWLLGLESSALTDDEETLNVGVRASLIKRIEINFDPSFLEELEAEPVAILEALVEIVLACRSLHTLCFSTTDWEVPVTPWPLTQQLPMPFIPTVNWQEVDISNVDVGFIVSVLLTASQPLRRLDLRFQGTQAQQLTFFLLDRHQRESLRVLWGPPEVLQLLFPQASTLPLLHAFVFEQAKNNITPLRHVSSPVLRSTTVLSSPLRSLHGVHIWPLPDSLELANLFGCNPWTGQNNIIHTVGLSSQTLGSQNYLSDFPFPQAKSLTILFQDGFICQSLSLEDNLFSIASRKSFPQLTEIRLWLPLPLQSSDRQGERVSGGYVWKERLEKIAIQRPEISFLTGRSNESWRAKMWRNVTVAEAIEFLLSS